MAPERPNIIEHGEGGLDGAIAALHAYQPDLLIEGGSNRNPALFSLLNTTFTCPYVGLDLRDDEAYTPEGFTRYGNCLRPVSVTPVVQEHGATRVGLVTWNALNALLGNSINPDEHKKHDDRLDRDVAVVNITRLYGIQLHLGLGVFFSSLRPFYEECAKQGWTVIDYGDHNIFLLTKK